MRDTEVDGLVGPGDAGDTFAANDIGVAPPRTRRVAVVVLGMHRSGTSALSRVLALLGCALPRNLLHGNPTNPTGHWEPQAVANFNDELLEKAGSRWDDWLPINPAFARSPAWPDFLERGRALLREEFGNEALFVLKDPRICRLVPFWLEVLRSDGIEPAIVLPLRNPLEVAHSLAVRDGSGDNYNLLVWLRHALEAEVASRGLPRIFTSYKALLRDWESLARRLSEQCDIAWPRLSPVVAEEVERFLDKDLHHHSRPGRAVTASASISPWISGAYEVLRRWAATGEDADDYPLLDEIRNAFDAAAPAFARPLMEGQRLRESIAQFHGERDRLNGERDAITAERDALAHERDTVMQRLREVEEASARAQAAREGLSERLAEASSESDELRHKVAVIESTLRQREEEIAQMGLELAASREEVAVQAVARNELEQEVGELAARLAEADAWVFRLANERRLAEAEMARVKRQLGELRKELEDAKAQSRDGLRVRAEIERWRESTTQLDAKLVAVTQSLDEKVQLLEAAVRERQEAREQAATFARSAEEVRGILTTTQSALDERFGEIATLTTLLRSREQTAAQLDTKLAEMTQSLDGKEQLLEAAVRERQEAREQAATFERSTEEARDILTTTQSRLDERFGEIATLTSLLRSREQIAQVAEDSIRWLRDVHRVLSSCPWWWAYMPRGWQERKRTQRIRRKGLFDAYAYLDRYPDVTLAGMDPLRHYILHGQAEGRLR